MDRRIFGKDYFLGLKTFVLIVISIALVVMDYRFGLFNRVKPYFSTFVLPFSYVANAPKKAVDSVKGYFTSRHDLEKENTKLREQELLLSMQVQQLSSQVKENAEQNTLNAAYQALEPASSNKPVIAKIIAASSDPLEKEVIIDKGKDIGAFVGQPVVTAEGLVGQVIDVGPLVSRILLINSAHSAVPVEDSRSGVRAIAVGDEISGELHLLNIPITLDVVKGDSIVTSGLGLMFPAGYNVGVVKDVQFSSASKFAVITLTPSVSLDKVRFVVLVWPKETALMAQVHKLMEKY